MGDELAAGGGAPIVVYGGTLDALAAAEGLLDLGVAPDRITLVRPGWGPQHAPDASAGPDAANTLGDAAVDACVSRALEDAGVRDVHDHARRARARGRRRARRRGLQPRARRARRAADRGAAAVPAAARRGAAERRP